MRRLVIAGFGFGAAYLLFSKPARRESAARAGAPEQTRRIRGAHGDLMVRDGGRSGLPIVCLHGLGGSSEQWSDVFAYLRRGRRAIGLDFRGHGKSDRARDGAYGIADLAGDVEMVANALGLEEFVLAGHSLGATVAIEVAERNGARVAGLLLVDPNGDQTKIPEEELTSLRESLSQDPKSELAWHYRQILAGSGTPTRERVLGDLKEADPDALRIALESALGRSPLAGIEAYEGRILGLLSPLNDLPYSLHRLLPSLPVRYLQGSHWLMLDQPRLMADLMEAFAQGCSGD